MRANNYLGMSPTFTSHNGTQWASGLIANGYDNTDFGVMSANMFDQPTHASMVASKPHIGYQNQFNMSSQQHESANCFGQRATSTNYTPNLYAHQNDGSSSTSVTEASPASLPLTRDAANFTGMSGIDDGFIIPGLNLNVPMASIEDNKDDPMAGAADFSDDNRTITAPVTPF